MSASQRLPFRASIAVGIVLAIVGVGSYVLTDFASVTALIPAIWGVLFVGLGRYGIESDGERPAAYGIAALAVLGIAGSGRVVPELIALVSGESVDSQVAVASQGLMILLCLVVLVLVGRFLLAD